MRLAHLENNVVVNISVGPTVLPGTVRICDKPCCDIGCVYDPATGKFSPKKLSVADVQALRQQAYPPLADFADAYYWSVRGDNSKMEAYIAACDAVKDMYPLPS